MGHVKAEVIPVLTGSAGTISNSFRPHLNNTQGNHESKELQKKTAILGTAYVLS